MPGNVELERIGIKLVVYPQDILAVCVPRIVRYQVDQGVSRPSEHEVDLIMIRKRGDGATAFDDATGQVSGTWVLGRPAAS